MPAHPLSLPPHGVITAENARYLAARPVPRGFRADLADRDRRPASATEWERWLDELAHDMSRFLWPRWRGGWVGEAREHAEALTRADLALMLQLQDRLQARIAGSSGATCRQVDAFEREDTGVPGETFAWYESALPAWAKDEMTRAVATGGRDIARPASQGLKRVLQRPRPQQVSLLWGLDGLVVQPSASAITPAMVSGHCLQGALALAQVSVALGDVLASRPGLDADVQRFLIDTGDRRVLAGLHYPSDNVGSWYVALRLADHVFDAQGPAVRSMLWSAIRAHSAVYRSMEESVRADAGSPYVPLLRALQAAAQGSQSKESA